MIRPDPLIPAPPGWDSSSGETRGDKIFVQFPRQGDTLFQTCKTPDRDLRPVIDSALASLSAKDREALLLRFYRSLTVREVAAALGIGVDAAHKRIDRAMDRLRAKLARRGVQARVFAKFMFFSSCPIHLPDMFHLSMKAIGWFLPLGVLLAGGLWIGFQFTLIADLEQQNQLMRGQIASHDVAVSRTSARSLVSTPLQRKPVDWEEVALQLDNGYHWGQLQANLRLLDGLESMSEDELIAALDEIAAAGLPLRFRQTLERRLAVLLMARNPERCLTRFVQKCHKDGWGYLLATALRDWAVSDPGQATAWLSAQFAAGTFDSRELGGGIEIPRPMVREPVFALLSSNPDAAGRFLATVPENLRLPSLVSIHNHRLKSNGEDQRAWAMLVRQHLSPADHLKAITWPTQNWSDGDGSPMDLAQTSAYLSRIGASAGEIEACVLCVAGQVKSWRPFFSSERKSTAEGLESLRRWVSDEAPHLLDRATSVALGVLEDEGGDPALRETYLEPSQTK